ncbi:hypothetical protein SLE2022_372470 [Rubroshorea leprosula]
MNNLSTTVQRGKEREKESTEQDKQDEDEEKPRCEWDFSLSTVVSSGTTAGAVSDALGVIEFDPSHTVIATGGIARKIRIYCLKSLFPESSQGERNTTLLLDHSNVCSNCICTPAKLGSLRWKPGSGGKVIGSGDYDGVVMEYDLEKGVSVFERDEHGGRRVWSVDYTHWDPVVGASGSDDGTVQMWDPRCGGDGGRCVAVTQPSAARSPVCSVEFNPFGGPLVTVGCADRKAYGYDVRRMVEPTVVFDGHKKAVTYVKFLDSTTVISAGTDGCLKLWNVNDSSSAVRTYRGHVNHRSFVGLSVWRHGGLLGSGSEDNQVFVYDRRWGKPTWVHGNEPGCDGGFVNSVCWRQVEEDNCTLVAGGSNGTLQVFMGRRKACYEEE